MGVGAGKFLGVRKIFARISPIVPEKFSEEESLHVIFSNQTTLGPIFARILRKFAQIFRGFAQVFTDFAQISTDLPIFSGILPGFSPDQNFWGCACTPAPPLPTSL